MNIILVHQTPLIVVQQIYSIQTFFVMNRSLLFTKLLKTMVFASTVEPTSTSNSIFETSDGYRWKYMYSLTSSETLNFMSTDFIHVSTDSTVSRCYSLMVR